MSELIGQTIERYIIESLLGDGGMGTVYQVYDSISERLMALKMMHAHLTTQENLLRQFTQEIEALRRQEHKHILPLYDTGMREGRPYFVTELLEGIDLRGYMRQLKAHGQLMSLTKVRALAEQVALALAHMHQYQVVHRDVKPENLFLRGEGASSIDVVLIDFGLAQLLDDVWEDEERPFQGSAPYMAPEVIAGQVLDPRSDLYALGIVLYELLCGRPPFEGTTTAEILHQHQNEPPPVPSSINATIPADLETLILRLLAKNTDHRYQTGNEVVAALNHLGDSTVPQTGAAPGIYISTSEVTTQLEMREYVANVRIPDKIDLNETWYGGEFRLIVGHARDAAVTYSLHKPVLTIGRDPNNDIVLSDYCVSRHHARLEKVTVPDGTGDYSLRWQLLDEGSTNGVHNSQGENLKVGETHIWEPQTTWRIGPYFLQWEQLFELARAVENRPAPSLFAAASTVHNGAVVRGHVVPPAVPATTRGIPRLSSVPQPDITSQASFMSSGEGGFAAQLDTTIVKLAQGEPQDVSILARNDGTTADDLLVQMEGHSQGIVYESSNARFLPGEEKRIVLTLSLIDAKTAGGAQTVMVSLRSQLQGRTVVSLPMTIDVAAVRDFHQELQPANVEGRWWRTQAATALQVFNNGNEPEKYLIRAGDPNDAITFEWENEWVTVPANQHRSVPVALAIKAEHRPLLGSSETFPFHMRVSPDGKPAEERQLQGNYKVPARVPLWLLVMLPLMLFLCGAISFLAYGRYQSVQTAAVQAQAAATEARENLNLLNINGTSSAEEFAVTLSAAELNGEDAVVEEQAKATNSAATLIAQQQTAISELTSSATPEMTPEIPLPTFVIAESSIAVNEGDRIVIVDVGLTSAPGKSVSIDYRTEANSATAGEDFETVSGQLLWEAGDSSSKPVRITILSDDIGEPTELFDLIFRIAAGALGGEQIVTISIEDDDGAPAFTVSASAATVQEGSDNSSRTVTVQVALSGVSNETITATCKTADGTALAGKDYVALNETISWAAGENGNRDCVLSTIGDNIDEPNETLSVLVTGAADGSDSELAQLSLTITDDDAPPIVTFEVGTAEANEGENLPVNIILTGQSASDVIVNVAPFGGSAVNGVDYKLPQNAITWSAGSEGAKPFVIQIVEDTVFEQQEQFRLQIASVENGNGGEIQSLEVSIIQGDNDLPNLTLSTNALEVSESEGNNSNNIATYTVMLGSIPEEVATVLVTVDSEDCLIRSGDEEFDSVTSLTFTSNEAQTVEVKGKEDPYIENPLSSPPFSDAYNQCKITHSGSGGDGYFDEINFEDKFVNVQVQDNDTLELRAILGPEPLFEDGNGGPETHTYQVSMLKQPAEEVDDITFDLEIAIVGNEPFPETCLFDKNDSDQSKLIFSAENWNVNQAVTVRALSDDVDEGVRGPSHPPCVINYSFSEMLINSTTITMRGDDEAGIIILTEADGIVGSGDTDDDFFVNEKENTDNDQNEDFEIVLTSRPLEGVKVVITSSDPSLNVAQCQIKLAGGTFADSVEFNRENNWDTAQKLEVRAIDDNIDESKDNTSLPADPGSNDSHSCALQVTITSDDPKYNWDPPPSTNPDTEYLSNVQTELNKVIINDNDQPPEITVISINSTLVPPTPTPPPTSFEINQGATDIDIKAELSMEGRSAKKITITVKLLGDNDATCDDATLEGDTADASTGDEFIWDILADGSKEATAFQILANGGNDALKECFRIQFVLPANPPANGDGPPQIMNPGPYLIAINLPNPVTLLLTPSEQTALNTPLPNQPLRPELN